MTEEQNENKNKALPQTIPRPTYWPFLMALALLFVGWGLLTIWIIFVAGLIGFFIALAGWIKELLKQFSVDSGGFS